MFIIPLFGVSFGFFIGRRPIRPALHNVLLTVRAETFIPQPSISFFSSTEVFFRFRKLIFTSNLSLLRDMTFFRPEFLRLVEDSVLLFRLTSLTAHCDTQTRFAISRWLNIFRFNNVCMDAF